MIGSIVSAISRGGQLPFQYVGRGARSLYNRGKARIQRGRQARQSQGQQSGSADPFAPNFGDGGFSPGGAFGGSVPNAANAGIPVNSASGLFNTINTGVNAFADAVGAGFPVLGSMLVSKGGKAAMAGTAAYMGGSAIKGFSEEVQKTPGFEQMSDAGQMAFRATTFTVGTALQVKGVFGAAGGLAGSAGLTRTSKALNKVASFAAPTNLVKGVAKMGGRVMAGTAKMGVNTIRGTSRFGFESAKSAAIGGVYGARQGLDAFGSYIATARNPYLGAMGAGMAAGGYKALDSRQAKARLTPRTTGTQSMNRSNYNRVSNRARRMAML